MAELDVRGDIAGREPFPLIMAVVHELSGDEPLVLIAPFEPEPLYGIHGELGFKHEAKLEPSGVADHRQPEMAQVSRTKQLRCAVQTVRVSTVNVGPAERMAASLTR